MRCLMIVPNLNFCLSIYTWKYVNKLRLHVWCNLALLLQYAFYVYINVFIIYRISMIDE